MPPAVCHLLLMDYKHSAADHIYVSISADIACLVPLQLILHPV